jgi:hypothetical protein
MNIEQAIHLLKTVFIPIIQKYLSNQITPVMFERLFLDARLDVINQFDTASPEDIINSIDTIFMDIDETCVRYDPNNPWYVEYLEEKKDQIILEPELRRRTAHNYQTMLALIEKYDKT